jgi:hypothetical protein
MEEVSPKSGSVALGLSSRCRVAGEVLFILKEPCTDGCEYCNASWGLIAFSPVWRLRQASNGTNFASPCVVGNCKSMNVVTEKFASDFAAEWIAAWNARDLERMLKHYARDVEFTSPFVGKILHHGEHTLRGTAMLRVYFSRALNAYPDLFFIPRRVYCGAQSVVIEHQSVSNLIGAEMMEFNDAGLVCRVHAHYATADSKTIG